MYEPAFGLGNCAQVPARIAHQNDTRHALGILTGEVTDDAHDDVGFVLSIRTVNRNQTAVGIKIVFHKIAGRKLRCYPFRNGRQHFDDFIRVDHSALAHADNLLGVVIQRLERLQFAGGPDGHNLARAARTRDAHNHVADLARLGLRNASTHHHLFQSQPIGRRGEFVHDLIQFFAGEIDDRPNVKQYPVPVEPPVRAAPRLEHTHTGDRFREHALQVGELHDAAFLVAHRR